MPAATSQARISLRIPPRTRQGYAALNALFGGVKRFSRRLLRDSLGDVNRSGGRRVGLNETEAKEKNVAYDVTHYPLEDLDRAIADGETTGVVKVLTAPGRTGSWARRSPGNTRPISSSNSSLR